MNALQTRDAYDDAVEVLTNSTAGMTDHEVVEFFDEIWEAPYDNFGGCLFAYTDTDDNGWVGGCLTQVKRGAPFGAQNAPGGPELLQRILADERLPSCPTRITVESLPTFAAYQRDVDAVLGRKPLRWDDVTNTYARA